MDEEERAPARHRVPPRRGARHRAAERRRLRRPEWSVRVSFANLDDHVYDDIGRAVRAVARGYGRPSRPRRPRSGAAKPATSEAATPQEGAAQDRAPQEGVMACASRTDRDRPRRVARAGGVTLSRRTTATLPRVRVLATGGTIAGAQASAERLRLQVRRVRRRGPDRRGAEPRQAGGDDRRAGREHRQPGHERRRSG